MWQQFCKRRKSGCRSEEEKRASVMKEKRGREVRENNGTRKMAREGN